MENSLMWPTILTLKRTLSRMAPRKALPRRPAARPCLEALEDRCLLSSGALDPTFGSGGTVTTSLSKGSDMAHGVLLQPNGNLIAYGSAAPTLGVIGNFAFGLARYTPGGSLDSTFGSGGIVTTAKVGTTTITGGTEQVGAGVRQAALQADGKIVAVGVGRYLVRYNSNGSIDTTFGAKGLVTVPSGFSVNSVLIQPGNGDIVVGGGYQSGFALLAYTPKGNLDSSFGNRGEVETPAAAGGIGFLALESGDIVAGGGGTLARYTLGGSLDTTFGSGGIVTSPVGISSLLVQPNGQIVAVGNESSNNGENVVWALARYNVDGSLDSSFGSGGIVTSSPSGMGGGGDMADGSALQANVQIVVVGWNAPFGNGNLELGVYNPNGSLDTSFGSGGFVYQSGGLGAIDDYGSGVVIQPDGKIVAAGSFGVSGSRDIKRDFLLARYGPSAAQVGSFTASPNPVTSGSTTTLTASNITLADPGSTITQVAFYVQVNGSNTLLGYGTQTSPGVRTFAYTVNLTPGSYTLTAQAQDSDGVLGDPVSLTLTVQ
jgi:uncharacterized delta-60 repeat protein